MKKNSTEDNEENEVPAAPLPPLAPLRFLRYLLLILPAFLIVCPPLGAQNVVPVQSTARGVLLSPSRFLTTNIHGAGNISILPALIGHGIIISNTAGDVSQAQLINASNVLRTIMVTYDNAASNYLYSLIVGGGAGEVNLNANAGTTNASIFGLINPKVGATNYIKTIQFGYGLLATNQTTNLVFAVDPAIIPSQTQLVTASNVLNTAIDTKQSGSALLTNLLAMGITNIVAGTNVIIRTNAGTLVINGVPDGVGSGGGALATNQNQFGPSTILTIKEYAYVTNLVAWQTLSADDIISGGTLSAEDGIFGGILSVDGHVTLNAGGSPNSILGLDAANGVQTITVTNGLTFDGTNLSAQVFSSQFGIAHGTNVFIADGSPLTNPVVKNSLTNVGWSVFNGPVTNLGETKTVGIATFNGGITSIGTLAVDPGYVIGIGTVSLGNPGDLGTLHVSGNLSLDADGSVIQFPSVSLTDNTSDGVAVNGNWEAGTFSSPAFAGNLVLITTNISGRSIIKESSVISVTELGNLDGSTNNIQTQLNTKASTVDLNAASNVLHSFTISNGTAVSNGVVTLVTNAITVTSNALRVASANTNFTSLLSGTNPPIIKTLSASGAATITDNGSNIVIGATTGAATPGGTNYMLQWNNNGVLDGATNTWWDRTNSRVGLGTNAPGATLHVHGNTMINGVISRYNGQATTDNGVASIVARAWLTAGSSAVVGTTTLYTPPTSVQSFCRVSVYLECTTAAAGQTLTASIGWTDDVGARLDSATIATDSTTFTNKTFFVNMAAGTGLTYELAKSASPAPNYGLMIVVERLK